MSGLINIQNRGLRRAIANQCVGFVGLAIGNAGQATVKTANSVVYTIDGVYYSNAAFTAQSLVPTHGPFGDTVGAGPVAYVQPANTSVIYLLVGDTKSNVFVVQGSYAGQPIVYPNDLSRVNTGTGGVPFVPSTFTTVGAVKVATAAGTTFTPGTTALDATGLTVTFINIAVLPETL